ncbi:pa domain-containing protein [Lentinula edodes]|uniref:Pa domain-containing protein n=1 Tax=Lentinula edodes TaxID=5353 RepID=A0A1Q3EDL0_LENED|nr:pa domain-containing protein [Lentinula edodes]
MIAGYWLGSVCQIIHSLLDCLSNNSVMSNNSNLLSGLLRSISRRSQRRDADTEESEQPLRADVDMESESQQSRTADPQTAITAVANNAVNANDGNQSDSSMPALQDVSDSEDSEVDSEDEDEDEARRDQFMNTSQVSHSGDDDEDMPSLESTHPTRSSNTRPQGTRRARVEDDVDGDSERDRRHPSQRASNNQSEASSPLPIHPVHPGQANNHVHRHIVFSNMPGVGADAAGPLPPFPDFPGHQHHPLPLNMMAQMGFDIRTNATQGGNADVSDNGGPGNNTDSGTPEGNNNSQPRGAIPNTPNGFAAILQSFLQAAGGHPGATFTTAFNGVPVGDNLPNANAGAENGGGNSGFLGNLFTVMSGMEGGAFTFNTDLPGGIPFFGFRPAQERENPERAKVLVDGLEEVPVGLIRRLERVSPESSGCAICWEKLLEQDAEYLRREEQEQKKVEDASKAGGNMAPDASSTITQNDLQTTSPSLSIPSSTPSPSSSASKGTSINNKVPTYPRIVSLPCSHVFHSECLLPWFTRPRQTTCPTCRFNIDPDDLTRGVGIRRRAAASTAAGGRGGTETVAGEDAMPSASTTTDGFGAVDPATGLPAPLSVNAQRMPFIGSVNGRSNGMQVQPPFPGMTGSGARVIRSGFFSHFPPGMTPTPRTASNENINNSQGHPPRVNHAPSTRQSEDRVHSMTSSNPNASVTASTANAADINPSTLIPPGAPRLPTRQPWSNEDQLSNEVSQSFFSRLFSSGGIPGPNPGVTVNDPFVQSNPPLNNASQPHVHPHPIPHMHPQGNIQHHHHAGDSYVTIGFDFVLSPNAPLSGPIPPQAGATGNTPQNAPLNHSDNHGTNNRDADNSYAAQDGVPHQTDSRAQTSGNSEAELPNEVEFHTIGVDIGIDHLGSMDPSSFDEEEDFMSFPDILNAHPQRPEGPVMSSGARTPGDVSNSTVPVAAPPLQTSDPRTAHNNFAANQRRAASSDATGNNAQPNPNTSPRIPDITGYLDSMFGSAVPGTAGPRRPQYATRGSRPRSAARGGYRTQERRPWAPPPPPGLTLRQTIEKREREAGLRCWDVSCGLAPDDDCPLREIPEGQKRQVRIRQGSAASTSSPQEGGEDPKGKGKEKADHDPEPKYVCEHTFHTPCLVSAQRVALNGAEEVIVEEGKSVEVSCPICRTIGVVPRDDWEDGVRALESDLD